MSVGYTEHDTLLALGIVPVGLTEWYGDWEHGVWPWALDELGDARPEVLNSAGGVNFEAIADLEPDLILGVNGGLDAESYAELSRIAPTAAQPEGTSPRSAPTTQSSPGRRRTSCRTPSTTARPSPTRRV